MSKQSDPPECLVFTVRLTVMPSLVFECYHGAQMRDLVFTVRLIMMPTCDAHLGLAVLPWSSDERLRAWRSKALLEMNPEMISPKDLCFLLSLQFPPCCCERTRGMSQGHGYTRCGRDCPRYFRYVVLKLLNQQTSVRIGVTKVKHTHCEIWSVQTSQEQKNKIQ